MHLHPTGLRCKHVAGEHPAGAASRLLFPSAAALYTARRPPLHAPGKHRRSSFSVSSIATTALRRTLQGQPAGRIPRAQQLPPQRGALLCMGWNRKARPVWAATARSAHAEHPSALLPAAGARVLLRAGACPPSPIPRIHYSAQPVLLCKNTWLSAIAPSSFEHVARKWCISCRVKPREWPRRWSTGCKASKYCDPYWRSRMHPCVERDS